MKTYDHKKIEKKWQSIWEKNKIYQAKSGAKNKKFYGLIEFPYPSGSGLHVGHIRSNTAMDIISRKRRMEGYNVLYPIGWDAFGLPTENYAIKTGIQPEKVTKINTDIFRKQLKSVGFGFDWSREVNTTNPTYYKWTQWIFLQMFKKGLAYKKKTEINWCTKCKIGLANEEVVNGVCERCGGSVVKKEKEQWMLAITKYADRLDKDLDDVDYLEKIKLGQRNWIGKSEGSEIEFKIKDSSEKIKVFTTRADTIFGATYVVLAPEHELVEKLKSQISNKKEVEEYIKQIKNKPDIERTAEDKEKTGIKLKEIKAINPANNEEIPVWIADYVLVQYGTGAVMAVPQHDTRDKDFAIKYNLPIINRDLVDSNEITKKVGGKIVTKYKLRDWIFSRQRYWGEPIPIIHCDKCGYVPVPEKDLPVVLPKIKSYQPTDNGESPLITISKWVNTKCPKCKGKAKRETDTMPNWAGSSWYYLRYVDSNNKKEFASMKKMKYWTPVDWYNGGMEHVTLHLLYSRFWHKFLYDLKLVPTKEPYKKRTAHGMILAEGGEKMSKSKGNTIDPKDIVATYGADTLRIYEMFIGPFDQTVVWNTNSIIGSRRFLERVWKMGNRFTSPTQKIISSQSFSTLLHKTIKKITEDIESISFNTAISSMMILVNEMEKNEINKDNFKMFLQILAPFAPHITEEIWDKLGEKKSIHISKWPEWDKNKIVDEMIKIAVQVNGKVRTEIMISKDINEESVKNIALKDKNILVWIENKEVKRVIYVPNRIINIVIA
jgi:leucyl-tRNA synthetase